MALSGGRSREQATNRKPCEGGIAEEATATGRARGYAHVGTVEWRIEP
jgi:hypothetical protein